MKAFVKKLLTSIVLVNIFLIGQSQAFKSSLEYSYDANGNRVKASIIYLVKSAKEAVKDSTDTIPQIISKNIDTDSIPEKGWEPGPEDNISGSLIKLYPNPAHSIIIVEISNSDLSKNEQSNVIQIFDLQGKMVYHKTGVTKYSAIDLSMLSNGTYILKLYLGDQLKEYKIVKN